MDELGAMVKGRRNHPSIIQWDLFNEAKPSKETVQQSKITHTLGGRSDVGTIV